MRFTFRKVCQSLHISQFGRQSLPLHPPVPRRESANLSSWFCHSLSDAWQIRCEPLPPKPRSIQPLLGAGQPLATISLNICLLCPKWLPIPALEYLASKYTVLLPYEVIGRPSQGVFPNMPCLQLNYVSHVDGYMQHSSLFLYIIP